MADRGAPLKNTERDKAIVQRVLAGETAAKVALDYGITPVRVTQIMNRHRARQAEATPPEAA